MKIKIEKIILDTSTGSKITLIDEIDLGTTPTAQDIDSARDNFKSKIPDLTSIYAKIENEKSS